jgi:hypothetical protein
MGTYRQNDDGSWSPAVPLGIQEEHNRFERLIFWLLRRPHCQPRVNNVPTQNILGAPMDDVRLVSIPVVDGEVTMRSLRDLVEASDEAGETDTAQVLPDEIRWQP